MEELIGKTIKKININEDKTMLHFECEEGDIVYYGYGDCCAKIYFEDIEYPDLLQRNYKVQDVHKAHKYGNILNTDKGPIVIPGRYHDNGYGGYDAGVALADDIQKHKWLKTEKWTHFKE